jgi:AcrR family transcriptional regulator
LPEHFRQDDSLLICFAGLNGSLMDESREITPLIGKIARPRGRPKVSSDEAKRSHIVASARKIFVELGYAGTTTATVAARCSVSKQTLYRLFASKEELFLAVVVAHRRMMLDLPRPPEENLAVSEALEKIFLLDMDEATDKERAAFIHVVIRESDQFPELREVLHNEGMLQSRQHLADCLSEQQARKKLEIDDSLSGARMLMDMIFGGMGPPEGRAKAWPDREIRSAHLKRCLAIFSRGVGAQ